VFRYGAKNKDVLCRRKSGKGKGKRSGCRAENRRKTENQMKRNAESVKLQGWGGGFRPQTKWVEIPKWRVVVSAQETNVKEE